MDRWKRVSDKKLSARKRGVFVDKKLKTARILSCGGTLPLPSGVVGERESSVALDSVGLKVLPCVFLNNILCSYRRSLKIYVMDRCWGCSHFLRFEREMDEEDEKMMIEIDRERAELDARA